ncbi:DUF4430 domain-containing protein [Ornithinibacillus caprae]|nr:DUF4430 domain-containing protein [Ornithinibacillus caprae]
MKRMICMVLAIIMTVFVVGCAKDGVNSQMDSKDQPTRSTEVVDYKSATIVGETDPESKEDQEVAEEGSNDEATESNDEESEEISQSSDDRSTTSLEDGTDSATKESKTEHKKKKESSSKTTKSSSQKESSREQSKEKPKEQPKDTPKEEPKEEPTETVTISITTGDVRGVILSSTTVPVQEGDTVLDVTRRVTKEKGIQLSVRGSGATAYVEGIDNLYEFDEGPLSGWLIRVDGVLIDRSTGIYPVEPNQTIKWIYTTNYLEDGFD